jgi:Meiotically up-regulated gene 113
MFRASAIYFMQAAVGGPIKIGFSDNVSERLVQHQIGCPFELRILAEMPGTMGDEAALHRRFADYATSGEWFSPECADLVSLIESLGGEALPARAWDPAIDRSRQRKTRYPTRRTNLGPNFNEGARLLWDALETKSWTHNELCRRVGATHGAHASWLYGDGRPRLVYALKLEELFAIPVKAWDLPPTEAFALVADRRGHVVPTRASPAAPA